jgi:hypothetical protein
VAATLAARIAAAATVGIALDSPAATALLVVPAQSLVSFLPPRMPAAGACGCSRLSRSGHARMPHWLRAS